jgi:hypothetical protein
MVEGKMVSHSVVADRIGFTGPDATLSWISNPKFGLDTCGV